MDHKTTWMAAGIGAMALALAQTAPASAEADFAGKTITIVVGFGAGGGYDAYARLAADHLGAFLPGRPTVIVDNMTGGGGRKSEAYLATAAPTDGTVISLMPNTTPLDSLEGGFTGAVTANDFFFIGRLSANASGEITWKTSATKTFADAKTRETIVASSGVGDPASFVPRIMNTLFGTQFKIVQGYKGTSDMALAMERGEVEGFSLPLSLVSTLHPDWMADHAINILWQSALNRSPEFADVPAIMEFATNDDERALLGLAVSTAEMGRSLAAPPGVPADVVTAYRKAFDAMVKDADFLADAKTRRLTLDPQSGEDLQAFIKTMLASPAASVERFQKIMTSQD
jgi:tripartite-type tricarboxylate transporter receptor subunit TctC